MKYLSYTTLLGDEKDDLIRRVEIQSNDTIDEELLWNKIKNHKLYPEILSCAIQLSISGYGNRNFLQYKHKGESKDMKKLFRDIGVKSDNTLGSLLAPDDITPRRLQRIFRAHVHRFLELNLHTHSYMFFKYSDHNNKFRTITYPGAEFMITTKEEADHLIRCYEKMDRDLQLRGQSHGIKDRVLRILLARNLYSESSGHVW
jgi:hypothetical protein